jgi:hypothetical protein
LPCDDSVGKLVTWTKANISALKSHIERLNGSGWISCILRSRAKSEYIIYGYFVDRVLGSSSGHIPSASPFACEHWFESDLPTSALSGIFANMSDDQVAFHIQSFVKCDIFEVSSLFRAAEGIKSPTSLGGNS